MRHLLFVVVFLTGFSGLMKGQVFPLGFPKGLVEGSLGYHFDSWKAMVDSAMRLHPFRGSVVVRDSFLPGRYTYENSQFILAEHDYHYDSLGRFVKGFSLVHDRVTDTIRQLRDYKGHTRVMDRRIYTGSLNYGMDLQFDTTGGLLAVRISEGKRFKTALVRLSMTGSRDSGFVKARFGGLKGKQGRFYPVGYFSEDQLTYNTQGVVVDSLIQNGVDGEVLRRLHMKRTLDQQQRVVQEWYSGTNQTDLVCRYLYDDYEPGYCRVCGHVGGRIRDSLVVSKALVGGQSRVTRQWLFRERFLEEGDKGAGWYRHFSSGLKFSYQADGKLSELIVFRGDPGSYAYRIAYAYDALGRLQDVRAVTNAGSLFQLVKIHYDME